MTILNDSNFKEKVLECAMPVLVDFYADWCGPCKMMAPVMEELAKEYEGRASIVKVNVDESPETSKKYQIMSIPAFLLFQGGEPTATQIGAVPKNMLTELLDQALA